VGPLAEFNVTVVKIFTYYWPFDLAISFRVSEQSQTNVFSIMVR